MPEKFAIWCPFLTQQALRLPPDFRTRHTQPDTWVNKEQEIEKSQKMSQNH